MSRIFYEMGSIAIFIFQDHFQGVADAHAMTSAQPAPEKPKQKEDPKSEKTKGSPEA